MTYNPKALVVLKNFGESPQRHLELVDKLDSQFGTGGMHGTAWHIDLGHGVHVHNHDIVGWDGWIPGNMLNEFMDGIYPPKPEPVLLKPPEIIPPPPPPPDFIPAPPQLGLRPRSIAAPKFVAPTPPPTMTTPEYDYEETADGFACCWPGCDKVLKTESGIKSHISKVHG